MAGTVTALVVQQRNKQRVNVDIDGEFCFGLAISEAARLHKGQYLTDAEIDALKARDASEQAYERALSFLSYRPRSAAEVRRNLRDHHVPAETIDAVIERLERANLVNDAEFARFWIENRQQFRPRSASALRYELRQKGIPDAVVTAALADLDETALAYDAARARLGRLRHADPETFRRRLSGFLARQGFAYPLIREVVETLLGERESAHEAEGMDHAQ